MPSRDNHNGPGIIAVHRSRVGRDPDCQLIHCMVEAVEIDTGRFRAGECPGSAGKKGSAGEVQVRELTGQRIIDSRRSLPVGRVQVGKQEAEGGCGVVGLACNAPLEGKYLLQSLVQMRNRGNGKGGGIAAVGLVPEQLGVSKKILEEDYILQVAYLDKSVRKQVEDEHIRPFLVVDYEARVEAVDDYHSISGLEVQPPDVFRYFRLEDFKAHVWIGHHRYPTKGRVWHPGGAHPFVGLNEALVHNGDFANYHSIMEYLAQRNIHPLFLTDTEVSVLLFDLLSRVYKYPLEYLIEALAPTTERDFELLPEEKKKIYRLIQSTHIHGSPDGPWFFIVARNDVEKNAWQLLGITDTSMLRPQVFAVQEGPVKIGIIASERQAINAVLGKLQEDQRIPSRFADSYWNARGGSFTDGGAFLFTVRDGEEGKELECADKFGNVIDLPKQDWLPNVGSSIDLNARIAIQLQKGPKAQDPLGFYDYVRPALRDAGFQYVGEILEELKRLAMKGQESRQFAIQSLSRLFDRIYDTGRKKRSSLLQLYHEALNDVFSSISLSNHDPYTRLDWKNRSRLTHPLFDSQALVVDALEFPAEGDESAARFVVNAHGQGWKNILLYNLRGHR